MKEDLEILKSQLSSIEESVKKIDAHTGWCLYKSLICGGNASPIIEETFSISQLIGMMEQRINFLLTKDI